MFRIPGGQIAVEYARLLAQKFDDREDYNVGFNPQSDVQSDQL
jgi:hypothetical protein